MCKGKRNECEHIEVVDGHNYGFLKQEGTGPELVKYLVHCFNMFPKPGFPKNEDKKQNKMRTGRSVQHNILTAHVCMIHTLGHRRAAREQEQYYQYYNIMYCSNMEETQVQYPPFVQVTIQLNTGAEVLAREGKESLLEHDFTQNTSHHDTS
jgi:hypothetical protein